MASKSFPIIVLGGGVAAVSAIYFVNVEPSLVNLERQIVPVESNPESIEFALVILSENCKDLCIRTCLLGCSLSSLADS